jgi:hypothetical protein
MTPIKIAAIAAASLTLAGCYVPSRQETFTGGGAALGAIAGYNYVVGAPGVTTAAIAGAVVGGGAGYLIERYTRPAPPASMPAGGAPQ